MNVRARSEGGRLGPVAAIGIRRVDALLERRFRRLGITARELGQKLQEQRVALLRNCLHPLRLLSAREHRFNGHAERRLSTMGGLVVSALLA